MTNYNLISLYITLGTFTIAVPITWLYFDKPIQRLHSWITPHWDQIYHTLTHPIYMLKSHLLSLEIEVDIIKQITDYRCGCTPDPSTNCRTLRPGFYDDKIEYLFRHTNIGYLLPEYWIDNNMGRDLERNLLRKLVTSYEN